MILESRQLEQIDIRHMAVQRGPAEDFVVWWYGAMLRNWRDKTLPLVVVWFRRLFPDGSLGPFVRHDVGVTELALLQLGTIWNEGACKSQIRLQEREFDVDFSPRGWRHATQAGSRAPGTLIPPEVFPLRHRSGDRSDMLSFHLRGGAELLIPSLEFFSRCYGRSAEVNRILTTYSWSEAESRLHMPHTEPVPAGVWSVKLPNRIYNDDALLVAHIKYDIYARRSAKKIYADLDTQFGREGLAFPEIDPWFTGPATLIVQGLELDRGRFLGLRIVGVSEPEGPKIWSFRENPGPADEPAPEGAPQGGWASGRDRLQGDIRPLVNITPTNPAGQDGNIAEVRNPTLRIVGARRTVVPQRLETAKKRPGPPDPNRASDQHSAGERQGAGGETGVASIHTQTALEFLGAARDVWNALLYLLKTQPHLIEAVGWYSPQLDGIDFKNREPGMVTLQPYDEEQKVGLAAAKWKWVYIDPPEPKLRGVLIAYVKTPSREAYLFEIERRNGQHTARDGTVYDKEQAFCGLIVSPPADTEPDDWIPEVLKGIREHEGVMSRVTRYCPGHLIDYYRRSSSKGDEIAGHSTVISALSKIDIDVPHPKDQVKAGAKAKHPRKKRSKPSHAADPSEAPSITPA